MTASPPLPSVPPSPRWRRLLWRVTRSALLIALIVVIFLLVFQRHLIYLPQRYADNAPIPAGLERLDATSIDGKQVGWWRSPGQSASTPRRIWLLFSGNASNAWQWEGIAAKPVADDVGVLLIDWPGYGWSEGNASPAAIDRTTDCLVAALAKRLNLSDSDVHARIGVIGHSLGAAAAMRWAARNPCAHAILIAPFTSTLDMARLQFGTPLCHLLHHRFDNRTALEHYLSLNPTARATIIHGVVDETIPFAMARELTALQPERVQLIAFSGMNHNDVVLEPAPWRVLQITLATR